MTKILIVGGTGFLGRACLKKLSHHSVSVVGRKDNPCFLPTENIEYHQLDTNNAENVERFLKKDNYSHLLYLAWPATLSHGSTDHLFFAASSVQFLKIFSSHNPCARIISVGSIHETGLIKGKVLNVFENMKPKSLYGVGKKIVWDSVNILGIKNFCWIRLANVYGVGDHLGKVLFKMITSELKNDKLVLSHPEMIVDFVHINDATTGILSALFSECSGVINIGGGYGYRLKAIQDFVSSYIQKVVDKKEGAKIKSLRPSRGGLLLDLSKASELLDYKTFVEIEQGISECIEFLKNEEN
jgi:nucleoside-diphosphate-sugar epimerase